MDVQILTPEGLAKLKEELEDLKTNKRKEIMERIKNAKEYGDLSENAEYHDAKEVQSFIQGLIAELEYIIKTALVQEKGGGDKVGLGSQVKVEKEGQSLEFIVVGSTEADPINRRISVDSPLGQAFINRKVGEVFEVQLPAGVAIYKILEIK